MEGLERRLRSRRSFAGCVRALHSPWWGIDDNEVMTPAVSETKARGAYITTAIRIRIRGTSRCGRWQWGGQGGRVSVSGVLAELALKRRGGDQRGGQ